MWFNKKDERALFLDKRNEVHHLQYPSGNYTERIEPDMIGDFTDIKQPDNSFHLVVFDPPHIVQEKPTGRICKKYGVLQNGWEDMLKRGFMECFRVLKPNGVLVFKWNECHVPIGEILALTSEKPLFGNKSGKAMKTHWVCFIKAASQPL
jgi:23S rRNA G2069 N7-methylase RlmK/C1962 C5-methylase RlmI